MRSLPVETLTAQQVGSVVGICNIPRDTGRGRRAIEPAPLSDEQKREIVQETERPGVTVARVCRRHGVATSMIFRWRIAFGLTAPRTVTDKARPSQRTASPLV
ncbi:transposase [Mesorhizobium sp. NPDC059025]|uniref:transposase n=1 Tax=unclassified Mesorhizobium TaxID=325217 RepID=UPI0036709123